MLREIGRLVALLHDGGMVHGDLTTSNMLLRDADGALVSLDLCVLNCYAVSLIFVKQIPHVASRDTKGWKYA
jgi:tRNA A-37 threonylcarbamoyl transferase component Bud32